MRRGFRTGTGAEDVGRLFHPSWRLIDIDVADSWHFEVLGSYTKLVPEMELGQLADVVIWIIGVPEDKVALEVVGARTWGSLGSHP